MKVSTFADDLIGLREFATRLEKFIAVEQNYVEGSLVISLSSKYGSGKTSFLQMWKSSLEDPENKNEKPLLIALNAWESDYYGDPLFAIVSALVNCTQKEGEPTRRLVDAAKDFGWFATAIGNQVVNKLTGVDAVAAGNFAEKKKAGREDEREVMPDTFSIYEGRKNAMNSLKEAINEFVKESKPGVWFLVDELDRCRPDYAISYLETIKHIFDVKGAVFILAADRRQLENSARTAFGLDLDFEEYYRKFIHREITLPAISDSGYKKLAAKYVSYYLEGKGARNCFMKLDHIDHISELVGALKLTPRQIQEVFRILGHIFETTEQNRGRLLWCLAVGSIVMAALKIGEPRIYRLLGNQELEPKDGLNYLHSIFGNNHIDWWFTLLFTGGGLKIEEGDNAETVFRKVGLINEGDDFNKTSDFTQWRSGWGHADSSRFVQIYEKIEQISQWN